MPIYEYKCNSCDQVFEELVPFGTEGDHLVCSSCGEIGARRLISTFAAHGLENGHIAVGRKLTGLDSSSAAGESGATESAAGKGAATEGTTGKGTVGETAAGKGAAAANTAGKSAAGTSSAGESTTGKSTPASKGGS